MKWFKRKLLKWIQDADSYDNVFAKTASVSGISNRPDTNAILNFRIYHANNGQILEFTRYDSKTDRNNNSMYIINKDQEIGEYVAKCLSLESLK